MLVTPNINLAHGAGFVKLKPMGPRNLKFAGSYNTRDLGGLPTTSGSYTRFRAVLRSDEIDGFTSDDWERLFEYGVRTLIDLRSDNEILLKDWPAAFKRVQVDLDGRDDPQFWEEWRESGKWCTPLYYKAHLERFPDLTATVIKHLASSGKDGVLIHCGAGRDRTGLISMVLLNLAGVPSEDIAADHFLSHDNLTRRSRVRNQTDDLIHVERLMQEAGKTTQEIIQEIFCEIDIQRLLSQSGCSESDLVAVRKMLSVAFKG